MTKPKLTFDQVFKIVSDFLWNSGDKYDSFVENQDRYPVYLIGFRGYYLDTMGKPGVNDRGIYDDCICIVAPDVFLAFNGNTDPSRFRPGIATLIPGVHMYRKGKHGITTHTDGGYPAFRPATPNEALPVTRDGQPGIHEGIAINIHKGGYTTTSSEGCQTIHPDQWIEFQTKAYELMDKHNQQTIPYILTDWKQ